MAGGRRVGRGWRVGVGVLLTMEPPPDAPGIAGGRPEPGQPRVPTYHPAMNITLSVDREAVERACEVARRQGTTLEALLRDYIGSLAGRRSPEELAEALRALWAEGAGDSGGRSIRREDAYGEPR